MYRKIQEILIDEVPHITLASRTSTRSSATG